MPEPILTVLRSMLAGILIILYKYSHWLTLCNAHHDGDLLPAKVIPSNKACYVPHDRMEFSKYHFEYLCGSGFNWVSSSHGNIAADAIVGGKTVYGEKLYIGRVHHQGSLTPGKIHPSHGCMYIPFDSREISYTRYEVLVQSMPESTKFLVPAQSHRSEQLLPRSSRLGPEWHTVPVVNRSHSPVKHTSARKTDPVPPASKYF